MELHVSQLTPEAFQEFGSYLNPFDCGEPLNPGSPFEYYHDRLPLTFAGGNLVTLSVQTIVQRPLSFSVTEAHDFTEEVFGGFDADTIFHVGPRTDPPEIKKFKAFVLPKYFWVRVKRKVYHDAPFIRGNKKKVLGWVLLPPFTAFNDSREYELKEKVKIIV